MGNRHFGYVPLGCGDTVTQLIKARAVLMATLDSREHGNVGSQETCKEVGGDALEKWATQGHLCGRRTFLQAFFFLMMMMIGGSVVTLVSSKKDCRGTGEREGARRRETPLLLFKRISVLFLHLSVDKGVGSNNPVTFCGAWCDVGGVVWSLGRLVDVLLDSPF